MKRKLSRSILSGAAALLAVTSLCEAQVHSPLTNHLHPAIRKGQAQRIGRLAQEETLQLNLVLPVRDQAGLDTFVREVSDPTSPLYRQYLSVADFTARFGPTAADYQAVVHLRKAMA